MGQHRLKGQLAEYRLPQPPLPQLPIGSFVLCPIILCQGFTMMQQSCQWMVYQLAFEQAQAVVRPSLPERDLLGVWN
jgi:hypothetical protein